MTDSSWQNLGYGPWSEQLSLPHTRPTDSELTELELPRSIRPVAGEGVVQRAVFDPSLRGYVKAMRAGDPEFADPATGARWYAARREALDTVLAAVAASPWAGHLVLRGSVLLTAWFGADAREPGDLDFVVTPTDWELDDPRTDGLLTGLAAAAERLSGTVRLHADRAVRDEIWTYDRVPGRRLVLPWSADGLPEGTVQLDFVFTEPLATEPVRTAVPPLSGSGTPAELRTADRELSLAWKILWLVSDGFAQGKDLYDAVLLAESAPLRYELLRDVFLTSHPWWATRPLVTDDVAEPLERVEWDEFLKEHPQVGTAEEYGERLLAALAPTFGGRSEEELRAVWLPPASTTESDGPGAR
ncbi:nucleotidyl transferase AbiEii/AbiGii toxin family protein [Kitasatospora sp. DSM 101779]|uniref:nucleotidyl transferase AbiEii/AbiGii toxin family protein n=1 Tax=Kitasatospora sp. DSM 101779 TaxID=2853165 RepID=UPI0021D9AEDE|nr:nucleotidyl transferase AbiEii/AbiGii toxin family protein [Kitasatospora sp. DSM 101779]MCU7823101.1 nucleotidyl transferase AbiEii/AbiGii toxin family protein [Kitasatospora sp. DSM 101779]